MLIEVMVSALLVGLIAIATLNGFDASGRVTADERSHAQATVLAQQDEERLRSLPVSQLSSLSEERQVTLQKTTYTIVSRAQFISDASGTSSCSGSGGNADYIETASEVSWAALKSRPPVVETGLVNPPAGGELVVQVENGRGGWTSGMTVQASGPSTTSAVTGSNGCVILGPLEEGTYNVTTHQTGYVGKNGESEPPTSERAVSVTGQTTAKKSFEFAQAGSISATLETVPAADGKAQTLNVVAAEPEMTSFRLLQATAGNYSTSSITSAATFFPFASAYQVYAGTCEANAPINWGAANPEAQVEPGGTATAAVKLPAMIVLAYSGTKASPGSLLSSPEIILKDTDSGCESKDHTLETVSSPNTSTGDLKAPGLPYGTYTVCLALKSGFNKYHYLTEVENKKTEGNKAELFEKEKSSGGCP